MDIELSEEAKEMKRAYHREWQRKNKDKVAKYEARYWEKKARELKGNSEE